MIGSKEPKQVSAVDTQRDEDKLVEECGVFGVVNLHDASTLIALGLHALQHRGQEAAGIATYDQSVGFQHIRRMGYVRDNFTDSQILERLPGEVGVGHVRYSTAGEKGATAIRNVQPFFGEFTIGGAAVAHNGTITNANSLRRELIQQGSIFQSSSDTECLIHLMARSDGEEIADRLRDALVRLEGAFSIVVMTETSLFGVRDAFGIRPLVLGKIGSGWVLASETCALDIIGATYVRDIAPGEMVEISAGKGVVSSFPFASKPSRFCVFEHIYFSRPDSLIGSRSAYESRVAIGRELAKESPLEADLVCPIPDSGTPAAIGFSEQSGIPYGNGIMRSHYVGRTFIEPSQSVRDLGVRLKLNVNRALVKGKRVVLVDDSVVRGTTATKIKDMIKSAGAKEVHFRVASPPTAWPCFYGVDTPEREQLLAAKMSNSEMKRHLGLDSIEFISLDGLYRALGHTNGRCSQNPEFCDACFSGDYPVATRSA